MQLLVFQVEGPTELQCDRSRGLSVPGLPREKPIYFVRHLPNEDAL